MKKRTKSKSSRPLSAAVPQQMRDRLVEIAKRENRNLSQLVRIAIEEFLERRKAA